MTNGMVAAGRGFFPGKGGRRGFPLIGDEFGYFPHDKPYHDFGYPPNFPPPDGFFPGPMGFMGPNGPNGPNMDQPLPMGPMNGPPGGPSGMVGPGSMPPVSGSDGFPPTSMAGGSSDFGGPMGNPGGDITPSRPSPVGDDFTPNSSKFMGSKACLDDSSKWPLFLLPQAVEAAAAMTPAALVATNSSSNNNKGSKWCGEEDQMCPHVVLSFHVQ